MRKLVIGDIHGGYRAMLQVLERANFDKDKDLLIGLGDYADGWPDVYDTIEYLRNLPNFKGVIGNHDFFLLDFLSTGYAPHIWTSQGGLASLNNYQGFLNTELADKHKTFLNDLPYHLVIDNKLFVEHLHNIINRRQVNPYCFHLSKRYKPH